MKKLYFLLIATALTLTACGGGSSTPAPAFESGVSSAPPVTSGPSAGETMMAAGAGAALGTLATGLLTRPSPSVPAPAPVTVVRQTVVHNRTVVINKPTPPEKKMTVPPPVQRPTSRPVSSPPRRK